MIWQALVSALIGLGISYASLWWLPRRFPSRRLVQLTGPIAALFGGLLTYVVMGPDHVLATLSGALAVGVALLSLLIRPPVSMHPPAAA